MPATAPWAAAAEALLNRNMIASANATSLGRRLEGTSLQLEIEGITKVRVALHGGKMSLLNDAATGVATMPPADARITGSVPALLQLLRSGGTPAASRSSAIGSSVQISGDAEIANRYRELFAASRPDLEAELSRYIGDLPARSLSRLGGTFAAWVRRTRRTIGENIGEYLVEESRDLVNDTELAEFLNGVDSLRETTDRMEARLRRLELRAKGGA